MQSTLGGNRMNMLDRIHIVSILFVAVGSIGLSFFDIHSLRLFLAISVGILMVVLIMKTGGLIRISYLSFFILGLLLNFFYKIDYSNIINAFLSNTLFIALFVFTPLIKVPIELGMYVERLIAKFAKTPYESLSPILIVSNFILGSFMHLGGIRVLGDVFSDYMKKSSIFFGKILTRSFCMAAVWTPYFAGFSVAVAYSGGVPVFIIGFGLLFSILVLAIWIVYMLRKKVKREKILSLSKEDRRAIGTLILYFSLLVLSVVLLSHFTNMNVILIISLVSIIYSFLWCCIAGKFKLYIKALKGFVGNDMLSIREEAFMFITIGFFAQTLLNIGWEVNLPSLFGDSPIFVFLFIILFNIIVVFLALTGVHHLVTITILTTAVTWEDVGVTPTVYALTILLSWCLSNMTSPFSAPNIITARITDQKPARIGLYNNGLFGFYILIGGAFYLTLLNTLIN